MDKRTRNRQMDRLDRVRTKIATLQREYDKLAEHHSQSNVVQDLWIEIQLAKAVEREILSRFPEIKFSDSFKE